jgi:hypothetical protein
MSCVQDTGTPGSCPTLGSLLVARWEALVQDKAQLTAQWQVLVEERRQLTAVAGGAQHSKGCHNDRRLMHSVLRHAISASPSPWHRMCRVCLPCCNKWCHQPDGASSSKQGRQHLVLQRHTEHSKQHSSMKTSGPGHQHSSPEAPVQ